MNTEPHIPHTTNLKHGLVGSEKKNNIPPTTQFVAIIPHTVWDKIKDTRYLSDFSDKLSENDKVLLQGLPSNLTHLANTSFYLGPLEHFMEKSLWSDHYHPTNGDNRQLISQLWQNSITSGEPTDEPDMVSLEWLNVSDKRVGYLVLKPGFSTHSQFRASGALFKALLDGLDHQSFIYIMGHNLNTYASYLGNK